MSIASKISNLFRDSALVAVMVPAMITQFMLRFFGFTRNNVRFDPTGNIATISFWFDGVHTQLSVPYSPEYLFVTNGERCEAVMADGHEHPLHFGDGFYCRYAPEDFGAVLIRVGDRVFAQDERL